MAGRPRRVDDYFAAEASSVIHHEYGRIFATAGASVAHNHIPANI